MATRRDRRGRTNAAEAEAPAEQPLLHLELGIAYAEMGLYGDALHELEEAVILSPHDPEIRGELEFVRLKVRSSSSKH